VPVAVLVTERCSGARLPGEAGKYRLEGTMAAIGSTDHEALPASVAGYTARSSGSNRPVVKKWFSAFSQACMNF
jgi:hypothetical protein